jgi:hypothetical protein
MSLVPAWASGARGASIAVFACLLCAIASPALADPFALLASVKGKVEVTAAKGGEPVRASFGRPLERGDRVSVGPGGAATIYFSDGNVIELAEKSAVTVGGRVGSSAKVGPGAETQAGVYAQVSKVVTGGSRQSGLVALSQMRAGEDRPPTILAPRRADVLEDRPAFSWRAVEGANRYRVVVSGEGGELWSREVSGVSLDYPADADALARDADYLWSLEALSDRGRVSREESAFHVVSAGIRDAVRADMESISKSAGGPDHPAAQYLEGQYAVGRGLYHDAAASFTKLSQLVPESPAPHEALGTVYRAIGLMDLAAAEFQRALELTRPQ